MPEAENVELVEVYLVEPGKGRPMFAYKTGALEFLPSDGPLPQVGDIIILPRAVTGDSEDNAFIMGGFGTPFRVVEREHLYSRGLNEKHDPIHTKPAKYLKSWIHVKRLSSDEYKKDPSKS
jgi:hypothetical protein